MFALAFSLGGRLWRLDDIAGRRLGRGGRILLRTSEIGFELFHGAVSSAVFFSSSAHRGQPPGLGSSIMRTSYRLTPNQPRATPGGVNGYQLSTSVAFPGSRNSPCVIEVTSVDGRMISPTKLVVGDTHSIWLNHQTHVIPSRGREPAVPTRLTPDEGNRARSLFLSLAGGQLPPLTKPPPPPTTWGTFLKWLGKHVIGVLGGPRGQTDLEFFHGVLGVRPICGARGQSDLEFVPKGFAGSSPVSGSR